MPLSLTALYDKVNRTEPQVLRALVQGSAARLAPLLRRSAPPPLSLPGWQLRIIDGNHLPASEKRLAPLREQRGAAMPGHTLVVYDPDLALVSDIVACEDAHESERSAPAILMAGASAGQLWIAGRHFCTRTLLQDWQKTGTCFLVREHARPPKLQQQGDWHEAGRCETGVLHEQSIRVDETGPVWRRIRLVLEQPRESGDSELSFWSNLPSEITAAQIASLYRCRWRIEGLLGDWSPCSTVKSAPWAIRVPPCWPLPRPFWPTTS